MKNLSTNTIQRSNILADRILLGATALALFAENLSETEWKMPVIGDGRSIGVVVHHVASCYPIEIELAQMLAAKKPIIRATTKAIDNMNADHAVEFAKVGKKETLELLNLNGKIAADAVRVFSNQELENSATVSLNADAPLTAQFFIEDHALRHSYHHLAKIKASLSM